MQSASEEIVESGSGSSVSSSAVEASGSESTGAKTGENVNKDVEKTTKGNTQNTNMPSPALSFRAVNFAEVAKRFVEKSSIRKKVVIDLYCSGSNEPFFGVIPNKFLGEFLFDSLKLNPKDVEKIHNSPGGKPIIIVCMRVELDFLKDLGHLNENDMVKIGTDGYGVFGSVRGLSRLFSKRDDADINRPRQIRIHNPHQNVSREEILHWVNYFGTVEAGPRECTFGARDGDPRLIGIRNGDLELDATLKTHIPAYLPIGNRRTKITYRGQRQQCAKCYESDHFSTDYKEEKICWYFYV